MLDKGGKTMKNIIEYATLNGEQEELVVGHKAGSQLPGRFDDKDEINYDIMVINPAALDLLSIVAESPNAVAVINGNPLMQGEGELGIEWNGKTVPIGQIQFVPRPSIGAGIAQFERVSDTDKISGYKLTNIKPLGVINFIDARQDKQ